LKGGRNASCTDNMPCRHYDPCARCEAETWLTEEDWYVIGFYQKVADQVSSSGMPRLEGFEAGARLHGYPETHRTWLVSAAVMLHRLIAKQDEVNWCLECGKSYREIGPGDVIDGD